MNDPDDIRMFSHEFAEERLKQAFQDFLLAPEIAGSRSHTIHGARVPAEVIVDTGTTVEVSKEETIEENDQHSDTTILVHRNADNEIETIEVLCSCGRKTVITIDYHDTDTENEPGQGIAMRGRTDSAKDKTTE